ncbi:MAG: phosphopyruvate hydratase, partial [Patescibacteria group bacterium]
MSKIQKIFAREILASDGYPTIEVKVQLNSGAIGIASVPYGVSAGSFEAKVLTDKDQKRYHGRGMLKAVANVNSIITPALIGLESSNQRMIDKIMIDLDGTEDKSKLGGNTILAVSLAVAKATAEERKLPFYRYLTETFKTGVDFSIFPKPMAVVIEGGKHAHQTTDFQEYCLTALKDDSPQENIRRVLETYHELKKILQANGFSTNVGNEGAFAPTGIDSNEAPIEYIIQAIKKSGYQPGQDIGLSIDVAADQLYKDGRYYLSLENKKLTAQELIDFYENWFKKYPIISLEDGLEENDWQNWTKLNQIAKKYKVEIIGDDLTVTNPKRLQKAVEMKAISAIIIKPNQIGSLTETIDCCLLAKKNKIITIFSHRGGGETNDTSIIDLAVAVGSAFVKVGPSRGERVVKY